MTRSLVFLTAHNEPYEYHPLEPLAAAPYQRSPERLKGREDSKLLQCRSQLGEPTINELASNVFVMINLMRLLLALICIQMGIASAQDKYAVVVGVEAYDTGRFDPLDYANEDANALGKAFQSLGFTTKVMTSDSHSSTLRPSTPEKIARAIKTVAGSCGPGDALIVSLSGHGVQFSDEPVRADGTRETYFCPQDATLSSKASLVKISSLISFMNDSKATRKLLLIDSCRESVLSPTGKRKSAKRIELGTLHESRKSVPGGMSVLFSCSSKQFSWEHDDLGHSVFTNYVVQYLKGNAGDRFYDRGEIDLDGLVFYVRKRTNEFVFDRNLSADGQMPGLAWQQFQLESWDIAAENYYEQCWCEAESDSSGNVHDGCDAGRFQRSGS